jgi:hypothetical protein
MILQEIERRQLREWISFFTSWLPTALHIPAGQRAKLSADALDMYVRSLVPVRESEPEDEKDRAASMEEWYHDTVKRAREARERKAKREAEEEEE